MNREQLLQHPYPGLRPFLQEEAEVFFGRESQIETLIQKLLDTHFLAVVGTSGSGKSSLARAGLFPAIDDEFGDSRKEHFNVVKIRPGQKPFEDMAAQLTALVGTGKGVDPAMQQAFTLTTLKRGPLGLQKWWEEHQVSGRLLVFVDQFEEVFRFHSLDQNEAIRFVKLLIESARQRALPIYVCLTMRSEFLGRCTEFRDLPEMINLGQYLIPRLRRDELRRAIERPAELAGAGLTPRLSTRLVNEVGDNPDQLPILQHALMRAFENCRNEKVEGQQIDLRHLDEIGGLNDALGIHAEEIFESLDETTQHAAVDLFRTITVQEGGVVLRRPLAFDTIAKVTERPAVQLKAVIEAFRVESASFLLPGLPQPITESCIVDISHESLIRRWPRLTQLVEEEAEDAKGYHRLSESAKRNAQQLALYHEGKAAKPGEDYLLTGMDLVTAQNLRAKEKLIESWGKIQGDSSEDFATAIEFLDLSEQEEKRAQARKRRSRRLLRFTALAVGLLAISMGIMAAYAYTWYEDAREAQEISARQQAGFLSGYSKLLLDADPTMNLCLLNYLVLDPLVQREDSLLEVSFGSYFHRLLLGEITGYRQKISSDKVYTKVTFSPDRIGMATASKNKIVLWKREQRRNFAEHAELKCDTFLNVLRYSPGGSRLVALDRNHALKVWDIATPETPRLVFEHADVADIAFVPAGPDAELVVLETDGLVTLYDLHNDHEEKVLVQVDAKRRTFHDIMVDKRARELTVLFFEKGKFGQERYRKRRDSYRQIASKKYSRKREVRSVHSSWTRPGFKSIVSYEDNTAFISGHRQAGKMLDRMMELEGFNSEVLKADFSPDGNYVLVIGGDHRMGVWNMEGKHVAELQGHKAEVWDAEFDRRGRSIASVSSDNSILIWEFALAKRQEFNEINTELLGKGRLVRDSVGDTLEVAAVIGNEHLQLWNLEDDWLLDEIEITEDKVMGIGISEDGYLVKASKRGEDMEFTRYEAFPIKPVGKKVTFPQEGWWKSKVEFSEDGKFAACGIRNDQIRLVRFSDQEDEKCNTVLIDGTDPQFAGDQLSFVRKSAAVRDTFSLAGCLTSLTANIKNETPALTLKSGPAKKLDQGPEQKGTAVQQSLKLDIYDPHIVSKSAEKFIVSRPRILAYKQLRDSLGLVGSGSSAQSDRRRVSALVELPAGSGYAVALGDQSIDLFDAKMTLSAHLKGFGRDIAEMYALPDGKTLLLVFSNRKALLIPIRANIADMQSYMLSPAIFQPSPEDFLEYGIEVPE